MIYPNKILSNLAGLMVMGSQRPRGVAKVDDT